MSGLDLPTPKKPSEDESEQDSLEALREQLKAQRAAQKACLAKHKRTTFMAVETAKKGTTYFDPEKLREALEAADEDE